jgi:NOL1/NOP2/fmu family ribosome biogenesis protein
MPETREVFKVKQEFKNTIQERYSDEGVEKIKINEMEKNLFRWTIEGEVILKNGSKKIVNATIDKDGRLTDFYEEDIE